MYGIVVCVILLSECALALRRWEVYVPLAAGAFGLLWGAYRYGYAVVARVRLAHLQQAHTAADTPMQ